MTNNFDYSFRVHDCLTNVVQESIESAKKMIYFIKIHVPWEVLCIHGEDLMLRAPLQVMRSNCSIVLRSCTYLPTYTC
jgi:Dimerisation domain of Ca+-activated chloride-channel, anoctamin